MGKKKLTIEECKKISIDKGYILKEDFYKGVKNKMNFFHNTENCGFEFKSTWDNFSQGKGCPKCAGTMKLTLDYCKEMALKKGYTIDEQKYINCDTKMKFIHNCGFNFLMTWYGFYKQGSRCLKCSRLLKPKIKDCKKEADKYEYTLCENLYVNSKTKMKFIHNIKECGNTFKMSWIKFSTGQRCPICAKKQTESKIAKELKNYFYKNYNGKVEFKECINPKTNRFLPYDIYLEKDSKKIYIEVQGEQHYSSSNNYHKTSKSFGYQKYRDNLKKKHAEKNGIFIEIDIRNKKTIEEWILYIETIWGTEE